MRWYFEVLKRYALFRGRAQQREFWYFFLFNVIAFVVLGVIDIAFGGYGPDARFVPLTLLYGFAVVSPSIAVSVRRLHDTGRSGKWMFITVVPIIGAIVVLVFMAQASEPGENLYGRHPSDVAALQETQEDNTAVDQKSWHEDIPRAWAIPSFLFATCLIPLALVEKSTQAITVVALPLLGFSWKVWRKQEDSPSLFYANNKRTGWGPIIAWLIVTIYVVFFIVANSIEFLRKL